MAAAVLISLTPAALRWWWGRSLSLLANDAALPERLAAHNRRFGAVSGGCAALLVVGWPSWGIWSLPLLILAQAVGGFPLRKTLYQETWSLGACLSFFGRMVAAVFGFWLLLAATPWLASRAGRADWVAAAGLALALAGWSRYSGAIVRWLLRTRPITDPIVAKFEALVSTCGLPMPRFEYVPMNGGVLANAAALPSLRRSSVIFTDTLLSRLSDRETVAICAHELAHLEYYNRARLRAMCAANYVLIAIAAAMAPVTRVLSDSAERGPAIWLWPGVLLIALVFKARRRQQNETVSDVRAVSLTGDAESLAGALTTLHAVARVPRRWDQERERRSTHPSLARRIRDIRAAAGVAAATLVPSAAFRSANAAAVVTFEAARLIWQEGAGTSHILDYAALVELRLHASAGGAITLVAIERQGRRWRMAPETADLPALQAVLDVVDGGVTHTPHVPAFPSAVTRLVALLGWAIAFLVGQFAFGFVALLAAISPASWLLNGAGAAALAAAALVLRDGPPSNGSLGRAAVLAALGLLLFGLGWTRRGGSARGARGAAPALAVLGACATLSVAAIGLGGLSPIRLHQGARSAPAAIVLLVALTAAFWTRRGRPAFRYGALAAALAGALVVVLGLPLFLDRAGRDLFLLPAPSAAWAAIDGPALVEFDVPFDVEMLRLSPHAGLAAIERTEEDEGSAKPAPPVFHVGPPGGTLTPVEAADLTFVDDHRALLLVLRDGSAEVRDVSFDGVPVMNWQERIPDIRLGTIAYEARSNQWIVAGRDNAGQLVRAAGTIRTTGMERMTWNAALERGSWIEAFGMQGRAALIVERRYSGNALRRIPYFSIAPLLTQTFSESQLWRLDGGRRIDAGQSLLDTACVNGAPGDGVVCAAFDGTRTRIVAIDTDSGSATAIATVDGRFRADGAPTRGWLTGWSDSSPVALRLATREAIHPPVPLQEYLSGITATDAVVGTVAWKNGRSRIRLYPLPGALSALRRE